MTDRRLKSGGSELPPEASDYWELLAGRIDAAVAERQTRGGFAWLGANGARVGGVGVAAAAVLLAWALTQLAPASTAGTAWRRSLAPSDTLGRTLAVDQPPALGGFILAAGRSNGGATTDRQR